MPYQKRYIELDLLRTIAILGMILYHTLYDLQSFYGWDINVLGGGWKIFQIAIASLFLFLVGITSSFPNRHPFRRFSIIGAAALLVTLATYAIDPETYVRFGILHLIAVSALLIPVVARLGIWLLIPAAVLIIIAPQVAALRIGTHLLLPFGITYEGFMTVDYFPLIPWFSAVLIGYAAAPWFLQKLEKKESTLMSLPGRYSLAIYLVHQPIIMGLLWMIVGRPQF